VIGALLKNWECPKCKNKGRGHVTELLPEAMAYRVTCKLCGKEEDVSDVAAMGLGVVEAKK